MNKGSALEELVAQIHRDLAPEAVIKKNERIRGRSGTLCECDVTIRQSVGPYPALVVIECKDTKKKVGVAQVRVFVDKLWEVRATGVMVATAGYTRDALKRAHEAGILLLKHREVLDVDWEELLGPGSWLPWIVTHAEGIQAAVKVRGEDGLLPIPLHWKLNDPESRQTLIPHDLFEREWKAAQPIRQLGELEITCELAPAAVFVTDAGLQVRADELLFHAEVTARRYQLNIHLAAGSILEDVESGDLFCRQLVSNGIDWQAQMDTQQGVELTQEEYETMLEQADDGSALTFNLKDVNQYLRVVVTHKRPKR